MPVMAAIRELGKTKRTLNLFNTHTGERLNVCYFDDGAYRPEALKRVNYIMRDHRTGDVARIDPRLLDQLYAIRCRLRTQQDIHVISGYRSSTTNEKLRNTTAGVARKSLHTCGQAIDIRLPGMHTRKLRDTCVAMRAGGVGFYPDSNFIHLDTGRFRTW